MARRKKIVKILFGILIGVFISHLYLSGGKLTTQVMCHSSLKRSKLKQASSVDDNKNNEKTGDNNLLFAGVMTAERYLDSRAKAVYNTWGKQIPGKIMFFSSESSYNEEIPLVALPGVDDSYPPQKKSFIMLKYMHDNFIDQFEWFLRADDDVYVRTHRLEELLRSVDSRKPWFIGQTGRGNNEEFGLLSLESDENFCMGGPGVILSRETLRRMAPYVDNCLNNLYTSHEDVELGRCVRRFAGISCTWSYEASDCTCKMQVILYHNQSGQAAFTGDLKQKEVHRAITLHPVKQPKHMYRLHKYIKSLKVIDYEHESIKIHRDIVMSMTKLGYRKNSIQKSHLVNDLPLFPEPRGSPNYLGDSKILGSAPVLTKYKPPKVTDVLEWELIVKSLFSHRDLNPRRRIGTSIKEGLGDAVREIMDLINSYSKERGRVIDFREILYAYVRVNPVYGADLILDLLLVYRKYRGNKMTVQVRRHAYIQQAFTGLHVRELEVNSKSVMPHEPEKTAVLPFHKKIVDNIISNIQPIFSYDRESKKETINFILPLSGRYETFRRFVAMYEDVCIKSLEETNIFVILYKNGDTLQDYVKNQQLLDNLQYKYGNNKISVIEVNEPFSRARALQYGVNLLDDGALMLFIDVDIIFDSKSLVRIRYNTIKNNFIYFPIVYSLYNPIPLNKTYVDKNYTSFTTNIVDSDNGFWRQFGFGIVSLYKSDYLKLGGFNLSISGWGSEDVTFYDSVIKSNLRIIRCVDPSLMHVYHVVNCDESLDPTQKTMCLGTKANTLGSLNTLQKLYKKYQYLFR